MGDPLIVLPHDLFVNKLPNGEKEFFCYVRFPTSAMDKATGFSWRIASSRTGNVRGSGRARLVCLGGAAQSIVPAPGKPAQEEQLPSQMTDH
jgi:hypothetical protein